MDETKIVLDLIKNKYKNGMMIDVGASRGATCIPFLDSKWFVYAFEPNPERYRYIIDYVRKNPDVKKHFILEKKVVNDKEEKGLIFYLSNVSTGISSLTAFHKSHFKASFKVDSVRLDNYKKLKKINHVNFLKIDTEGHDYFVLQSYDWDEDKPDVIECEFEDLKTEKKLKYIWKDMANYLVNLGYKIVISEWYPIVKYGSGHKWRGFKKYPCELSDKNAWGNFLCFQNENLLNEFVEKYKNKFI